jgi:23S rRNA (uracil1939-C5)-methyltransferase/tRNA (uracil-5-)-methyltransferase
MVIDPPRKGCDADFREQLLAFAPARLVYVSCDPATQARDLQAFVAGGYCITRIQPFDLFPHTRHIENVVTLSRAEAV